jgi:hypothetical protein
MNRKCLAVWLGRTFHMSDFNILFESFSVLGCRRGNFYYTDFILEIYLVVREELRVILLKECIVLMYVKFFDA